MLTCLVRHKYFLFSVVIKVRNVFRITVSSTVIRQNSSVIVKNRTAENNLVISVIIHVSYRYTVCTLCIKCFVCIIFTCTVCIFYGTTRTAIFFCRCISWKPLFFKVCAVPSICRRIHICIISPRHNNAWMYTVKICHRGKVSFTSVCIAVAPFGRCQNASRRVKINSLHCRTCFTVKYS